MSLVVVAFGIGTMLCGAVFTIVFHLSRTAAIVIFSVGLAFILAGCWGLLFGRRKPDPAPARVAAYYRSLVTEHQRKAFALVYSQRRIRIEDLKALALQDGFAGDLERLILALLATGLVKQDGDWLFPDPGYAPYVRRFLKKHN